MLYNRILALLLVTISFTFSQGFSDGPYGTEFFDIAGPFSIADLNSILSGDINDDEIVNIQDVILVIGYILGNTYFNNEQINDANLNNDMTIDVLDIIIIINNILSPSDPLWIFEQEWNDEDCYIFINYATGVSGSSALWISDTKDELLENSPDNIHYFFISDRTSYTTDIFAIQNTFDEILDTMSSEEQNHWKKHLHFIPTKTSSLGNWLTESLQSEYAIGIDRMQRIKEIGYLGNPNGFTGTYMHYLVHEAVYYNSEWNSLFEDENTYDEITVWDRDHYTGGWASSISQLVDFPSNNELNNYSRMSVELLRGCPDSNMNYSDAGCDEYDRIAHMYICQGECYETIYYWNIDQTTCEGVCSDSQYNNETSCTSAGETWTSSGNSWNSDDGVCYLINYNDVIESECENESTMEWNPNRECKEVARWITPFRRQPHHLTDISPLMAHIRPGGTKLVKFQESGWPNSLITLKLRFYHNDNTDVTAQEFIPIWNGTVQFNPDYADNRPPTVFMVPENASKVEFVTYITGHGWGNNTCYNCCEFCNSRHIFEVNGGIAEFSIDFPSAGSSTHCMSLEMIGQGTVPNQYGTWGYGRAGWCPGLDVDPFVTDITDAVVIGDENIIDYDACRVSGGSCVTPPTCGTCGYCPEIPMSSYIIIYY